MSSIQHNLTANEMNYVTSLRARLERMREFLNGFDINTCDTDVLFKQLTAFCHIAGNLHNPKSFGACLLAKRYLENTVGPLALDISAKAQGAKGPDIETLSRDGVRIIGEIKTTEPHRLKEGDFGGAQISELRKDWRKLKKAHADCKYFFVTDSNTYHIIRNKYIEEISGIELVLLH